MRKGEYWQITITEEAMRIIANISMSYSVEDHFRLESSCKVTGKPYALFIRCPVSDLAKSDWHDHTVRHVDLSIDLVEAPTSSHSITLQSK